MSREYNFNERLNEWSAKQGKELQVWQTPKYQESKKTAIKIIEEYDEITEADFWILKNETKNGKVAYSGLIISHNGCLKINDQFEAKDKFRPSCVSLDKEGFGGSLVYTYACDEQGIYEVGEVSPKNCLNSYPYAMALKRCFDRVVLKISKLAFGGIYSEAEADEFKEPVEELEEANELKNKPISNYQVDVIRDYAKKAGSKEEDICKAYGVATIEDMTAENYGDCLAKLAVKLKKENGNG